MLQCTSALCERPAVCFVTWPGGRQPRPFCATCGTLLADHGDRVEPDPRAAQDLPVLTNAARARPAALTPQR